MTMVAQSGSVFERFFKGPCREKACDERNFNMLLLIPSENNEQSNACKIIEFDEEDCSSNESSNKCHCRHDTH